jgi:hypothetical protein
MTVLCGMESGSVALFNVLDGSSASQQPSYHSIGNEPVLSLDVVPSTISTKADSTSSSSSSSSSSCPPIATLIAAGMAGDSAEVAELDESEMGRCVVLKAVRTTPKQDTDNGGFEFQQRARLSTCRVDKGAAAFGGKPGVNVCRFRSVDGRILAIGGWDHRVRLFERSSSTTNNRSKKEGFPPLAILRNESSISSLDWSPDANTSGLLASSSNKTISIWRCYPSSSSSSSSSSSGIMSLR